MNWLLLRSVPQSKKQKTPQTLTGRVWFYYDSFRTRKWLYLYNAKLTDYFQRSGRDGSMCECSQGKV